jgi:chitin disaccharide deacetylase
MKTLVYLLVSANLFIALNTNAQSGNTVAAKLGYPAGTKLLIIHADDFGMNHSQNDASIKAMEKGSVNSASIMVPCPWFSEAAAYARNTPKKDLGLHLTLTSEWKHYKWGPVASRSSVSSLVNRNGYFYSSVDSLVRFAKVEEVEKELRSQIDKALANGIDVTHLDAHMYAAWSTKEMFSVYVKLGRAYKVPVLLTMNELNMPASNLTATDVVVDHLYQAGPREYDNGMAVYYRGLLKNLPTGLSCLLIHTAHDDSEMQAAAEGYTYWGSRWRQQDLDFFTSEECKKILQENGIKLVTWRELRDKITRAK